MEERYTIKLTFDQLNTLLYSGIYGGLDNIERHIKDLNRENPELRDFRRGYQHSIDNLKSAQRDIRAQLYEQGNDIIGWSPEQLKNYDRQMKEG